MNIDNYRSSTHYILINSLPANIQKTLKLYINSLDYDMVKYIYIYLWDNFFKENFYANIKKNVC